MEISEDREDVRALCNESVGPCAGEIIGGGQEGAEGNMQNVVRIDEDGKLVVGTLGRSMSQSCLHCVTMDGECSWDLRGIWIVIWKKGVECLQECLTGSLLKDVINIAEHL